MWGCEGGGCDGGEKHPVELSSPSLETAFHSEDAPLYEVVDTSNTYCLATMPLILRTLLSPVSLTSTDVRVLTSRGGSEECAHRTPKPA